MRCLECGGEYIEKTGTLSVKSVSFGRITVDGVDFLECSSCGEKLLPPATIKKIEEIKKEKTEFLIGQLPNRDFITPKEACEVLDITKQAFSKNKRIKRGFIYSSKVGGRKLYNKKSVELFKETGDGRFKLTERLNIGEIQPPVEIDFITLMGASTITQLETEVKSESKSEFFNLFEYVNIEGTSYEQ